MKSRIRNITLCIISLSIFCACSFSYATTNPFNTVISSDTDTTGSYSHSSETEPDLDVVFPSDQVNEILITISSDNWHAIATEDLDPDHQTNQMSVG